MRFLFSLLRDFNSKGWQIGMIWVGNLFCEYNAVNKSEGNEADREEECVECQRSDYSSGTFLLYQLYLTEHS